MVGLVRVISPWKLLHEQDVVLKFMKTHFWQNLIKIVVAVEELAENTIQIFQHSTIFAKTWHDA